jgi:hypothetical protein
MIACFLVVMAADNSTDELRYRCRNCGRMLSGPDERPCSSCHSDQREIMPPPVNETVTVTEKRTAILMGVKKNLRYLLATIAVMIGIPLAFFFMEKADLTSTLISVGAGILAFYLGYKALVKVERVYESGG